MTSVARTIATNMPMAIQSVPRPSQQPRLERTRRVEMPRTAQPIEISLAELPIEVAGKFVEAGIGPVYVETGQDHDGHDH